MVKTVTLIRHGQSKFNVGQCKNEDELRNCDLTEVGKVQASTIEGTFDILIVSTLKRAILTYHNSKIQSNNIVYTDLVREQREELSLNYLVGEEIKPESPDDMRKRVKKAIEYVKNLKYENIGIVTHAYFIWYFLEQTGNNPFILQNAKSVTIKF
jgi:broad specificity phosphatase PhoE